MIDLEELKSHIGETVTIEGYYSPITETVLQKFIIRGAEDGKISLEPVDKDAIIDWRRKQCDKLIQEFNSKWTVNNVLTRKNSIE